MPLKALLPAVLLYVADASAAQERPAPSAESVTASALRRIDFETHTPVHVITRQELARLPHTGLGQVLQQLPFMGGSSPNLNSNAAGDGSILADIGGLGRARCIVMLNGRRLPVNELLGEPAVDLDSLPLAAIERIEIFLGGASPVWGADAVSGVINVITRSDANGLEWTLGATRSAQNDGHAHRASAFAGRVFGRGHANIAMEYRDSDPIRSSARDFSSRSEALGCIDGSDCVWPFGSSATPAGVYLVPQRNAPGLPAGRYTADSPGIYRPFEATGPRNDRFSTQADAFLRAGRSGGSIAANGAYELTDATVMSFDLLATSARTHRQLSALPLFTTLNGVISERDERDGARERSILNPVLVSADHYYNPFGVTLQDVRRRLVELGPRTLRNDTDSVFLAGSARHTADSWEIDGALSAGRLRAAEHISHVLRGEANLQSALGPSGPDVTGAIRCGLLDPETGLVLEPIDECIPLDLFHGPGSITQPMLDYVTSPRDDNARITQTQARVIGRREITLGAPTAQLALGAESRKLDARFESHDFASGGLTLERGTIKQHDLLGEIAVPLAGLAGNTPTLLITTGGRLSWFQNRSLFGTAFAAAEWRQNPELLVRSRITQVHRAPSAGELFLGRRERILPVSQPCLMPADPDTRLCRNIDSPPNNDPLIVGDTPYLSEGNPRLRPERGYAASTGLAWNSESREERFVALDLTWTQLDDTIRAPGALELIEACRDDQNTEACDRIVPVRRSDSFLIDGKLINGGRETSARLDLDARSSQTTSWGDWRWEVFASYLLHRELINISGNRLGLRGIFDVTQSATGAAYPELRAQGRLQWSHAPWTAQWTTQFVSSVDEVHDRNGFLPDSGAAIHRVGSVSYHDVMLRWTERPSWSLQINIDNLFDRSPPRVNNGLEANTDSPTYRLEGRLYSLSVAFSH